MDSRATRLVRAADLQAFRDALVALATGGAPFDARDRLVIVPSHAAAQHLLRTIEDRVVGSGGVLVRPDVATPGELVFRLATRLETPPPLLTDAEREVLLGVAARAAREQGAEPPFRLRPALVAEALRFYDDLQRQQKDVDAFERLVLGRLEPSVSDDRGAARLAQQTRFLVAAFRAFEAQCRESGLDEHTLRRLLLATPAAKPYRHVVLAVTSRAFASFGVPVADWDLLARLPGLERLDVVITDGSLGGAPHEWFHRMLPGAEEVRLEPVRPPANPTLLVPPDGGLAHAARDREEEVAAFARRARRAVQRGDADALDRIALVVRPPLPYLYLGRAVLQSASVPCQMLDALPLAGEPVAAALDLVLSCAASNFARDPCVALLRSPFFAFGEPGNDAGFDERRAGYLRDVAALDRMLAEAGFLGERAALERLVGSWDAREGSDARRQGRVRAAARAGRVLLDVVDSLEPLGATAPVAQHLATLLDFWHRHERWARGETTQRSRERRARGGLMSVLTSLLDAYARFDGAAATVHDVAALVRRWIEGHTFGMPTGDVGVHIVDAVSAPFGEFDLVQLAGLVEGEWPEPPRHDTFYSATILRDLGWPLETDRLEGVRAAFLDLLRLPAKRLVVSTFRLELDALVGASPLLEEVERAGLEVEDEPAFTGRVFGHEALAVDPVVLEPLAPRIQEAARLRLARPLPAEARYHGTTGAHRHPAYSLSALERYQTCPFKFFAADVLRIEEPPDDATTVSPRTRGKLLHEIFQRFFEAWDAQGLGGVTPERMDNARAVMAAVAEPLLASLPDSERQIERARLFGSAVAPGAAEVVLGFEASRSARVTERRLEHAFEGEFGLGATDGRRVSLRGIADRIDLLDDGRLRVLDYKSGDVWDRGRALQVPVYALCAQEQLLDANGRTREVAEAGYVTLGGKQPFVAIVKDGDTTAQATLAEVRARVLALVDWVALGEFPPRPHDLMDCRFCPYPAVCRKDYVGDDL